MPWTPLFPDGSKEVAITIAIVVMASAIVTAVAGGLIAAVWYALW